MAVDYPEREGVITFKGAPFTLVGIPAEVGRAAPDFDAVRNDLSTARLSDWRGQKLLLSSVPSLDTPVCDMQTRRFNQEAAKRGVTALTVSMDLPFAQARWCGASGLKNVLALSDHRDAAFGLRYGLLIKELRLLARAVIVIAANGEIKYVQVVKETSDSPDFDAALAALDQA